MADTKVRVGQIKPGDEGKTIKVVSGAAAWAAAGAGTGDVIGPATSADNTIARFDGVDSKTIQASLATIDDTGTINIPTGQTYNINGSAHTHAGGTGDVIGPATNTDGNIPQWNGVNSKTLKDGLGLVTTVGSPGSDSSVPSEQAVREAIAASAGADANAIHVNASSEIHGITEKTTPADNDEVVIEDSAAAYAKKRVKKSNLVGSSANHAYYAYLAAGLEPLAVEPMQVGTFSYAINGSTTKMLIASWNTRLGAGGRMEVRYPLRPLFLRGATLTGLGATSTGAILDPSLPTYANARTTYFDRLKAIAETSVQYLATSSSSTPVPFLPGPYGSIITRVISFDMVGNISLLNATYGLNFFPEVSDTFDFRYDSPLLFPASKLIMNEIQAYHAGLTSSGGVVYVILPSSWGAVTDSTSYGFRDDFMSASLDTATVWTRAESTAGNVEIDTAFQWLKLLGNSNWGTNGCYTQTFSQSRTAGKILLMDVDVTRTVVSATPAGMFGWSDGGGHSYTNFSHGILFNGDGTIKVYENSNDRGVVGSGFSIGNLYRIRITLGASSAAYAIQGGTQYAALGGSTWTDITPGTTSSSTTPVYPGLTVYTGQFYAGDVRVY